MRKLILVSVLVTGSFLLGIFINLYTQPQQSAPASIQAVKTGTSSPTPTPTPKPETKGVTYDPVVECGTEYQRQKGNTIKVKKSVCDSWVDCQLYGNVVLRVPKEQCNSLVDCQVGGTVMRVTKEQCEKAQQRVGGQTGMVNCQLKTGWTVMKKEDCIKAQAEWRAEIEKEAEAEVVQKLLDIERRMWEAQTPEEFEQLQRELQQLQSP